MVNRGRDISSGEVSGGRGKWARRGGKGRLTGTGGGGSLEQKEEARWNRRGRLAGTGGEGLNGEESSWGRGLAGTGKGGRVTVLGWCGRGGRRKIGGFVRGEDGEEGGGGIMAEEGGGVIQKVNCLVNLKRLLFRRRNQDIGGRS